MYRVVCLEIQSGCGRDFLGLFAPFLDRKRQNSTF